MNLGQTYLVGWAYILALKVMSFVNVASACATSSLCLMTAFGLIFVLLNHVTCVCFAVLCMLPLCLENEILNITWSKKVSLVIGQLNLPLVHTACRWCNEEKMTY